MKLTAETAARWLVPACTLWLAACIGNNAADNGGNDHGTASVTDNAAGISLNPLDAIAELDTDFAGVTIISHANACSIALANADPMNSTVLQLIFLATDSSSGPAQPGPGTYTVVPPESVLGPSGPSMDTVIVTATSFDAECSQDAEQSALSGTATLTALATGPGTVTTGSFQLTFDGDGGPGTLSGSFSASYCNVPAVDGGPSACE